METKREAKNSKWIEEMEAKREAKNSKWMEEMEAKREKKYSMRKEVENILWWSGR